MREINRRETMGSSPRRVFSRRRPGRNSGFTWLEICIRPTLPVTPPPRCVYKSLDWDSRNVPPLSTSRDGRYCHGCEIYARYRRCSIIPRLFPRDSPEARGRRKLCSNVAIRGCAIDAPREICIIRHARSRAPANEAFGRMTKRIVTSCRGFVQRDVGIEWPTSSKVTSGCFSYNCLPALWGMHALQSTRAFQWTLIV